MKIFHQGTGKKFFIAAEGQSDWETWLKHLQLAATIYANTDKVRSSRIFTDKYGDAPPSTDGRFLDFAQYCSAKFSPPFFVSPFVNRQLSEFAVYDERVRVR